MLNGHSLHREHLDGPNEALAGSFSLKINLPLSRLFSFEDSENTCTATLPVALKILRFQHIMSFSYISLRISLYLLYVAKIMDLVQTVRVLLGVELPEHVPDCGNCFLAM